MSCLFGECDSLVSCQELGLAVTSPRQIGYSMDRLKRFVSQKLPLPSYRLPAPSIQYMEGGGSAPVQSHPIEKELAAKLVAFKKKNDRVIQEEKAKNEALEKRVSELLAAKLTLNNDFQKEKKDKQSVIDDLDDMVSHLEDEVSCLQKKLNLEKKDKFVLENDLKDKKSVVDDLVRKVSYYEAQVAELQENLHLEKNDKVALEKEIADLTSKLEDNETCRTGFVVSDDWDLVADLDVQSSTSSL